MSDRLIAWLRTVVPTAWAALIAWPVTLGAPDYLTDALGNAGELVVLPVVLGVIYPIMRAIEARLPGWLTRMLLGSSRPPSYRSADTRNERNDDLNDDFNDDLAEGGMSV